MYEKNLESLPADVAIFAAAVADFKIKEINLSKNKKRKFSTN